MEKTTDELLEELRIILVKNAPVMGFKTYTKQFAKWNGYTEALSIVMNFQLDIKNRNI